MRQTMKVRMIARVRGWPLPAPPGIFFIFFSGLGGGLFQHEGDAYKTKNAAFVSHDIQVGDRA